MLRVSMAALRQRIRNINSSDARLATTQTTDRNATDNLALDVQRDKRAQETTNESVQAALLRLTTELETTNRALVSLTATVTSTGETSTRAVRNTSNWVGWVDKRVNLIKTEIYTEANVPPAKLDATLCLLFVLKPNPIVETDGLYLILMGDGTSNIALAHYALSLWVVDELFDNGIDTDWLPPAVSESMPRSTDHRIKMNIQMHTSAKIQANEIKWDLKLSQAAASISVYLSHSLLDLYSVSTVGIAP